MKCIACLLVAGWLAILPAGLAAGQTAQVGANASAAGPQKLRVVQFHYRPARWDTKHVQEVESEYTNQGGLLYLYLVNEGGEPVDLRFWRYNNHDESYWLLNHFIAWHRLVDGNVAPGETTVLEINGTTRDFGPGVPFRFEFMDSTWEPCMSFEGRLLQDPVAIAYIRVLPDMHNLEVHLRNTGPDSVEFCTVSLAGRTVADIQWRGRQLAGAGNAIARVKLDEPLKRGTQLVVSVGIKTRSGERTICAHRRAFPEFFPIGTWNTETETEEFFQFLRQDHVDTVVKAGKKDDSFFGGVAPRFGFRSMVHTGEIADVDMVRDLGDHSAVLCWMLRDEPDWSLDPQAMLAADATVRRYNSTVPTYINLCRQIKFFEYAPIADIACHDHYCVTAPTSSVWEHKYGTRLEETAYYTEDLKYAAEPRPVWVWSQGNADGWDQRPKRPVPTPGELSAQLVLNVGRGAKGILWFTYHKGMGEKYPETRGAMRGWNRVLAVLRDDLSGSEPALCKVEAPKKVDVAPLVTWDKLILCVTNLDYEVDPEGYPFEPKRPVEISVSLPSWVRPERALRVAGDGIQTVSLTAGGERAVVVLDEVIDAAIVVLSGEPDAEARYRARYQALLDDEKGSSRGGI
jgi:hypothetical protein